jgi:hypothetical protein
LCGVKTEDMAVYCYRLAVTSILTLLLLHHKECLARRPRNREGKSKKGKSKKGGQRIHWRAEASAQLKLALNETLEVKERQRALEQFGKAVSEAAVAQACPGGHKKRKKCELKMGVREQLRKAGYPQYDEASRDLLEAGSSRGLLPSTGNQVLDNAIGIVLDLIVDRVVALALVALLPEVLPFGAMLALALLLVRWKTLTGDICAITSQYRFCGQFDVFDKLLSGTSCEVEAALSIVCNCFNAIVCVSVSSAISCVTKLAGDNCRPPTKAPRATQRPAKPRPKTKMPTASPTAPPSTPAPSSQPSAAPSYDNVLHQGVAGSCVNPILTPPRLPSGETELLFWDNARCIDWGLLPGWDGTGVEVVERGKEPIACEPMASGCKLMGKVGGPPYLNCTVQTVLGELCMELGQGLRNGDSVGPIQWDGTGIHSYNGEGCQLTCGNAEIAAKAFNDPWCYVETPQKYNGRFTAPNEAFTGIKYGYRSPAAIAEVGSCKKYAQVQDRVLQLGSEYDVICGPETMLIPAD